MGYYSKVEGFLGSGDASIDVDSVKDFVQKNSNAGFWAESVSPYEISIYGSGKAHNLIDDLRAISKASKTHLTGEVMRYGEDADDIEKFIVNGDVVISKKGRIVFD